MDGIQQCISRNESFRVSFLVQGKMKRATVGPLPGVTQDIAGYKVNHHFYFIDFSSSLHIIVVKTFLNCLCTDCSSA